MIRPRTWFTLPPSAVLQVPDIDKPTAPKPCRGYHLFVVSGRVAPEFQNSIGARHITHNPHVGTVLPGVGALDHPGFGRLDAELQAVTGKCVN